MILSQESCLDRCENGFDSQRKCQCDSMCTYYKSCCFDFEAICGMMSKKPRRSSPQNHAEILMKPEKDFDSSPFCPLQLVETRLTLQRMKTTCLKAPLQPPKDHQKSSLSQFRVVSESLTQTPTTVLINVQRPLFT